MRKTAGNRFLLAGNSTSICRIDEVTVTGDVATIRVIKNVPGVTAMTLVGNSVWIDKAKFDYRPGKPWRISPPGPLPSLAFR